MKVVGVKVVGNSVVLAEGDTVTGVEVVGDSLGLAEGDTVAGALLGLELKISDALATGVVVDPLMQSAILVPPQES